MGYGHSLDLRERIIQARQDGESQAELSWRFLVGYATVRRYLGQWEKTGRIGPKPPGGGMPRCIQAQGEAVLRQLLMERPDFTDEKLQRLYAQRTGASVSAATVNRTVRRLGLTRKKVTPRQREGHRSGRAAEVVLRGAHGGRGAREAAFRR
ncbi:hypothetical protein G4177_26215 [Corallococcus sp. ZKHCc1 1396]|uniref:Paired domain-containing protein n=1 Tax=Corallococcus soli TaxID=2710757 RepID=A0ABR9PUR6_9BACT|nr:hypothetical protein [Corallococcus soli]MBE4751673.1 hypothetical protein [Corallococcus soli]